MSERREHPGDLLSAYLDDELSGSEARQVEAHLVACGACTAELDELAAARRLLRGLPPVPAPAGFTRGLVERRRRFNRWGTGLAVVAASIAVIVGMVLADPHEDEPSGSQPMSLSGDASRLGTTSPFTRPRQGGVTTSPTTTTAPENETGSEESSDPATFGDRVEDVATNLLELIGG
jgi:anti-sigma factor RsiW